MECTTYFAYARNRQGQIQQVKVKRIAGKSYQWWTNKVYKSVKEANKDMVKLNCIKAFC